MTLPTMQDAEQYTYLNLLSLDQLRTELRNTLEKYYGILFAIRDLPEMPDPFVLIYLSHAAKFPEDWEKGKELQRKLGLDVIPPKAECESGAGLWFRIRAGLSVASKET